MSELDVYLNLRRKKVSMKRTEQAIQEFLDLYFNEAIEDIQKKLTERVAVAVSDRNFGSNSNAYIKYGEFLIDDISDIVSEYLADKGILLDAEQEEQTNE